MASPNTPNRFEMPFASDDNVRDLMITTRDWLTVHGALTFMGEVYGVATEQDGDMLVPTAHILGTGAVRYAASVGRETIWQESPDAIDILEIGKDGMTVMYDEAYYRQATRTTQRLIMPAVQFFVKPQEGAQHTGTLITIATGSEGGIGSSFLRSGVSNEGPDGSHSTEIKIHEHLALAQVMAGLAAITMRQPNLGDKASW